MTNPDSDSTLQTNKYTLWERVNKLNQKPIYPAIVRRVLITATEEEYFDHDLEYEEKYSEELELRQGFIVAHFEVKNELLGIGDCAILDIGKRVLLRAPRVRRCGLVLPMLSYQGYNAQPQDYRSYFEDMMNFLDHFEASTIKKSLRCY